MYELFITDLAQQDLDNVVSYIAIHLANRKAASDFLDEVANCYKYLKTNPMMYTKCQDSGLEKGGYRKAIVKNCVIIYKTDEEANKVYIMRFFYAARDYARFL